MGRCVDEQSQSTPDDVALILRCICQQSSAALERSASWLRAQRMRLFRLQLHSATTSERCSSRRLLAVTRSAQHVTIDTGQTSPAVQGLGWLQSGLGVTVLQTVS